MNAAEVENVVFEVWRKMKYENYCVKELKELKFTGQIKYYTWRNQEIEKLKKKLEVLS